MRRQQQVKGEPRCRRETMPRAPSTRCAFTRARARARARSFDVKMRREQKNGRQPYMVVEGEKVPFYENQNAQVMRAAREQ